VIVLSAYLVFSGWKMLGKAKITTKKENDNRALEASKLLKDDEMKKPLLSDNDNNGVNKRENFDKNNSEMSDVSIIWYN